MLATMNAFPPLHAFNSPRSWFLALVVLVHLGFFWALTSGLAVYIFDAKPSGQIVWVPQTTQPPKPTIPTQPPTGLIPTRVDPVPLPREVDYRETVVDTAPQVPADVPQAPAGAGSAVPVPAIVEPQG